MLEAMQKYMPAGVEWTKPEGGMFVWVTLPEHFDGAELLAKAVKNERIAFVPGRAFHADGTGANTIRLSFSCASDEAIDTGISRLGRLIESEIAAGCRLDKLLIFRKELVEAVNDIHSVVHRF
jgi:DNA-binding transcriptional MocR family regulator